MKSARVTAAMLLALAGMLSVACSGSGAPRGLRGRDRAAAAGLSADFTNTWSAPVGDVDGDGRPDFILLHHNSAPDVIYRNDAGRFTEFAPGTLFKRDRHNCTFGDVDRDGLTDIFCSIGGHRGTGRKRNELWIQQKNHTFVDRVVQYGVGDETGRGRYAALVDVNGDGYLDLFQGNETPRADGSPVPNRLFINDHGRRFRDDPGAGLDTASGDVCLQIVDYDRDGHPDLVNCANFAVALYRNDGTGRFRDAAGQMKLLPVPAGADQTPKRAVGYRPYWRGARLVDLDGDGALDAIGLSAKTLVVQRGSSAGFAAPVKVRDITAGQGIAVGDIDKDGKPDIYVVQSCSKTDEDAPDLMLRNSGAFGTFEEVPMEQSTKGCGDDVQDLDYNGDGRTDFIVLNGRGASRGPVRLMDFAP